MMNFKRLFSFSKKPIRSTPQVNVAAVLSPEPQESYSAFLALPPDLILYIADFLPLHAAACLALCSRSMLRVLGTQYWEIILQQRWFQQCGRHRRGKERVEFLSHLQRDLPAYHLCYYCCQLHSNYALGPPSLCLQPSGPVVELRNCYTKQGFITHGGGTQYRLRFQHVQLAMAQHHHGSNYGIPLDVLSFTEFEERRDSTTLISIEARIVLNELLMRTQYWVLISAERGNDFSATGFTAICPHLSTYEYMDDQIARSSCLDLIRCARCPTEFHLEIKRFGKQGNALVLTKWLSLGLGITPEDPKWRTHLRVGCDMFYRTLLHLSSANVPLGSIRSSFEHQRGPSVEVVTEQNEKRLFTKRKEGDVWKRSGGDGPWMIVPLETKAFMHNEHEGKGRYLQKY